MIDLTLGPWPIFHEWYTLAKPLGEQVANAMALATASRDAMPAVRIVLFRGVIRDGLAFYTNYQSRKGRDLEANPQAAVVLYWQTLGKQIRIEGRVSKLEFAESEAYFHARPRGSQVSAWASPQSQPIASQKALEAEVQAVTERFSGQDELPCPTFWGGYHLEPKVFEFWQEGHDRLHERIRFDRQGHIWQPSRLGP